MGQGSLSHGSAVDRGSSTCGMKRNKRSDDNSECSYGSEVVATAVAVVARWWQP